MINIAICDDDANILQMLAQYVKRYQKNSTEHFTVYEFSSGDELLRNYRMDFDIIFLDIGMEHLDGIETAHRIRLRDSRVLLFFLTSIKRYSLYGYELNAINYLIKPLTYEKFTSEMNKSIKRLTQEYKYISLKTDTSFLKLYLHDIRYVESNHRSTLIHTNAQTISSHLNMKQMESLLDSTTFFRCHTSFIVNFKSVRNVTNVDVHLTDDITLPLSRSRKKLFMEYWLEYLGETL